MKHLRVRPGTILTHPSARLIENMATVHLRLGCK